MLRKMLKKAVQPSGVYSPLKLDRSSHDIRLLTIAPGAWSDNIRCTLTKSSLKANPSYKALSYTWGDATSHRHILLNGHEFEVTENLWRALRRIRHNGGNDKQWWVDAICINQGDLEDKSHQVGMMKQIFSSSSETLAYLGEDPLEKVDANSEELAQNPIIWHGDNRDDPMLGTYWSAFEQGPDDNRQVREASPSFEINPTFHAFATLRLLSADRHLSEIPPFTWNETLRNNAQYSQAVNEALKAIRFSPWWSRIWIVQETVVAPNVTIMYGSYLAPISMIYYAFSHMSEHLRTCCTTNKSPLILHELDGHAAAETMALHALRSDSNLDPYNRSLFDLCSLFSHRLATDDHDKVYALLGLVSKNWTDPKVQADYRKSIDSLYIQVTVNAIKRSGSLFALCGDHTPGKYTGLPSWVVDWTNTTMERSDNPRIRLISLYHSTQRSKVTAKLLHGRELGLKGIRFDRVKDTTRTFPHNGLSEASRRTADVSIPTKLLEFVSYHQQARRTEQTEAAKDVLWKLLCGNSISHSNVGGQSQTEEFRQALQGGIDTFRDWASTLPSSPFRDMLQKASGFQGSSLVTSPATDATPQPDKLRGLPQHLKILYMKARVSAMHSIINAHIGGRCFFLTENGYIGVGHRNTEAGDEVFLLKGGKVPFALRRVPYSETTRSEARYWLVGDCYVQGIINAKVWPENEGDLTDVYLV